MNAPSPILNRASHFRRIATIAFHAFTQLARMKVFYFLAIFAVIVLVSNLFDLPQHDTPESLGVNVLRSIKSWSIGAMTMFSVVLAIVATALLIPKDIEDRTLYTILAKPVPRFDYLVGKLLGVLLLILFSLVVMDILMTVILHIRTSAVVEQQILMAKARGYSTEALDALRPEALAQGPTWALQGAVLAVFLRAVIIASLAMLISTFSTSTLFTTIVSFLIYFMGNFQADALEAYFHATSIFTQMATGLISLILPNFQVFNVIDAAIEGQKFPLVMLLKLSGLGMFYGAFYTVCSWFIFAEKEF